MRPSLPRPQHEAHTGQGGPKARTAAPHPRRAGRVARPECAGPGECQHQPTTGQQVTRHRPGQEERGLTRAAVDLAQAVREDRTAEAQKLAAEVLQRERDRQAMIAARQNRR